MPDVADGLFTLRSTWKSISFADRRTDVSISMLGVVFVLFDLWGTWKISSFVFLMAPGWSGISQSLCLHEKSAGI